MVSTSVAAEAGSYAPPEPQWVVFLCDGRPFGFPLERVTEIMTPRPFTRLPGAGGEVCGLIGVRGRIVTVIDLGVVLGNREAATNVNHRLLLLDLGARRIAAAVDDVLAIEPATLRPYPEGLPGEVHDAALLGTAVAEVGGFVAMDPAALLERLLQ
jgi:purine-binding chemotaxis protein CheW